MGLGSSVIRKISGAQFERWLNKVDRLPNGCWQWRGGKDRNGYAHQVHIVLEPHMPSKRIYAHRFAYWLYIGEIPKALTLDHLCRNRSCVNPRHLEPIPHRENVLRGTSWAAINSRKTRCPKGHQLAHPNLYITNTGSRRCRTCWLAQAKARRS